MLPGHTVCAVSIREPYASLVRHGAKTILVMRSPTLNRGPLLVCASTTRLPRQDATAELLREGIQRGLRPAVGGKTWPDGRPVPVTRKHLLYGRAVAAVRLVNCLPAPAAKDRAAMRGEVELDDYGPGRWAWVTEQVRPVVPWRVRGRAGVFEVELPQSFAWADVRAA